MEEPPEGGTAPNAQPSTTQAPASSAPPSAPPAAAETQPTASNVAVLAAERATAVQKKDNQPAESSFDAKYEAQRTYINRLQALTEKQRLEIQRLKEQNLKVVTEWQKKVQQLTQHNEIFQEQTATLEGRVAELEARLREVHAELHGATAAVQLSEARAEGLQASLLQADANQSRFMNFQRNVLALENQMLSDRAMAGRVPELEMELKAKQAEIDQLLLKQQQHADLVSTAEARVGEYLQRIILLEKERDERKAETTRHKRFVEYQKDVAAAKIEETEKKYRLLKDINFALEREILRLHMDGYKKQHFPSGEHLP